MSRRELGSQIPPSIEIRNPALDTRVKIDVPNLDMLESNQRYSMFRRDNIVGLCMKALRSVEDWDIIIERQLMEGKKLELAWRIDTNLDWVWLETDVYGKRRDWVVLCGLALKQVRLPDQIFYLITSLIIFLPNSSLVRPGCSPGSSFRRALSC